MNTYYVADMDTRVSVELWKLDWTAPVAAATAEGDGVVATVAASCVAIKYTHSHTHTQTLRDAAHPHAAPEESSQVQDASVPLCPCVVVLCVALL